MKSIKFIFCGENWTIKFPRKFEGEDKPFAGRVYYDKNIILVRKDHIGQDTLIHELFEAALNRLGHRFYRGNGNYQPEYIFMFDHGGLEDVCREVWSAYQQIQRARKEAP